MFLACLCSFRDELCEAQSYSFAGVDLFRMELESPGCFLPGRYLIDMGADSGALNLQEEMMTAYVWRGLTSLKVNIWS